jgi:hypothetical protein
MLWQTNANTILNYYPGQKVIVKVIEDKKRQPEESVNSAVWFHLCSHDARGWKTWAMIHKSNGNVE